MIQHNPIENFVQGKVMLGNKGMEILGLNYVKSLVGMSNKGSLCHYCKERFGFC